MYKITFKGEAKPSFDDGEDDFRDDLSPAQLKQLDGVDCQDNFSEYLYEKALKNKGIGSGYMHFELDGKTLYTIVEYTSKEQLDEKELEILREYTSGQLSDGIGEGFEQNPCHSDGHVDYYISPWFSGQELEITQE